MLSNTLSTSSNSFRPVNEPYTASHSEQLATTSGQRLPRLHAPASLDCTTGSPCRSKSIAERKNRLQAQIKALQADYAARLPALLEEIGACWRRCTEQDWRPEEMLELRQYVHKLAGSAASFGFAQMGLLASQVEDHLLVWESLSQPPVKREQCAVAELLQALRITAREDERLL